MFGKKKKNEAKGKTSACGSNKGCSEKDCSNCSAKNSSSAKSSAKNCGK